MKKFPKHPDDLETTYYYKGKIVTRTWPRGMYSVYTSAGRIMSDTQSGIKQAITEHLNSGGY